ncbi:pentatricopeptide repeat-containing protein At2g13600 isoform X2 [Cryptomeria japonica]|uniref:pentatricopeptide repeat-containing protein At2g13600 isoform X2 n=1 Tax=Cryptomeria japonica TaxID=3369 RepID=UPI0027DA154D|nr:pentatricopeptide repeat-containing protein At2g13600 isoform X2 [Cryptomeria japonica]
MPRMSFQRVKLIHSFINGSGFTFATSTLFQNKLMNMYAKRQSLLDARNVFDRMAERDIFSWNTMIAAYGRHGFPQEALAFFHRMLLTGVQPDQFTFASLVLACAKMRRVEQAMEIHQTIIESGLLSDYVLGNALIDMYAKCGNICKARDLFDQMPHRSVVSWNAMIAGYAKNGVLEEASKLLKVMPSRDVFSWTALIAGYAQYGVLDEALKLFKEMPQRNVISWTAMIAGYAQNGFVEAALGTFKQMLFAGLKPNSATIASILPACAKVGALKQGMELHQRIIESGFLSSAVVVNALIDMYAKCGSINKARELFDNIRHPNVVAWTAMISGHAGLLDEGCKYFNHMGHFYNIKPTMDHDVCMVDLLGRAGYLEEALNFIIKMPVKPDLVLWMCLLSTCKLYKNIDLGEFAATLIFELDPKDAAPYVLMSDIYAELGRWGEIQNMWKLIKDGEIKKKPGCSWIEVHKMIHAFSFGDLSHPQAHTIYTKLDNSSL